ncbi:hypothetical protein, variant [Cryptococcus amylolentus CBS 6039]|nr:hypothetical protein, variant [Cryptococcus amylolentus CBS 6039]ODN74039.1 hypothetical protein, variant [Cryptococcus amylolentus CBS 6039]
MLQEPLEHASCPSARWHLSMVHQSGPGHLWIRFGPPATPRCHLGSHLAPHEASFECPLIVCRPVHDDLCAFVEHLLIGHGFSASAPAEAVAGPSNTRKQLGRKACQGMRMSLTSLKIRNSTMQQREQDEQPATKFIVGRYEGKGYTL